MYKGVMDMICVFDKDWINFVYLIVYMFFYDDGKGDIEIMFDEVGDCFIYVLFVDIFNYKVVYGLCYIVNLFDVKVMVYQYLDIG